MEQFINGEICSYDAIIDNEGNPIFETGNITPISIMDIVNNHDSCAYYILNKLPADTKKLGRAAVKSFGVKNRFIHFEFFRLAEDIEGLGKTGELVGLEVNMRPSGGYTTDMINLAYSTDVYKIWADMITYGESHVEVGKGNFCVFIGRRDNKQYALSHTDLMTKYGTSVNLHCRMPQVLSAAMGDYVYIGTFSTQKKVNSFLKDALKPKKTKKTKQLFKIYHIIKYSINPKSTSKIHLEVLFYYYYRKASICPRK